MTDGTNVVFLGESLTGATGIYAWDGQQLIRIADQDTVINGFKDSGFHHLSVANGIVTFEGGRHNQVTGVYQAPIRQDPEIRKLVDTNVALPDELGTDTFANEMRGFSDGEIAVLQLMHDQVVGQPGGDRHTGVFDIFPGDLDAKIRPVLHPNLTDNPLGELRITGLSSFDGTIFGVTLEGASGNHIGAFEYEDPSASARGSLHILASDGGTSPAIPERPHFQVFSPVISRGHAAFVATYEGLEWGIILKRIGSDSDQARKVIDPETTVPGTTNTFTSVGLTPAYERRFVEVDTALFPDFEGYRYPVDTVIFAASTDHTGIASGDELLMMWQNGALSVLAGPGSRLGETSRVTVWTEFHLWGNALKNGRLVFYVHGTDHNFSGVNLSEVFTALVPPTPFPGGFTPGKFNYDDENGMSFEFVGNVGETYTVQFNDSTPPAWQPLTNFTYTVPKQIHDPETTAPRRVYRAVSSP